MMIGNRKSTLGLAIMLCLLILSCGQETDSDHFIVTLICDVGGLGDKGFNDAGFAGCKMAEEQIPGVEVRIVQSKEQTDYAANLSLAAEKSDAVVTLGFLIMDAVKEVAARYPNVPFIFVDALIDAPNVAAIDFKSEEGAFLAGILAAGVSRTGKVATLPGMDIPPVEAFVSGFQAGVQCANVSSQKNVQALSRTIGSFNDPVKAKSLAKSLQDDGVDILFQLSGLSGLGVLEAVKESPQEDFLIGVDIDQDDLAPGLVLTSVLKRMDLMVFREIQKVHDGTFSGGQYMVGLAEEATCLTDMRHTKHLVPQATLDLIERAKEAIVAGKIHVPRTLEDLKNFQPVNLTL
ncbi:MAG TPA: BMP family ABC transporter substrate-binding protein [bacterium]|nr:BMP family ABC transporter substrate-binding protein [bacterium]